MMYIEKLPNKLNKFIKVAGYRKMCLGEIKTIYGATKRITECVQPRR